MEKTKKELIDQSRRRQCKQISAMGGLLILLLILVVLWPTFNNEILESFLRERRIKVFKEQFVQIQGGIFEMGNLWDDGGDDEKSVHKAKLSDFEISKYEITNQQYCDFLNSVDTSEAAIDKWLNINYFAKSSQKTGDMM